MKMFKTPEEALAICQKYLTDPLQKLTFKTSRTRKFSEPIYNTILASREDYFNFLDIAPYNPHDVIANAFLEVLFYARCHVYANEEYLIIPIKEKCVEFIYSF